MKVESLTRTGCGLPDWIRMLLPAFRHRSAALLWFLAFAIGGCVQFHTKPLSAEMGAVSLARRSLNDSGLHEVLRAQKKNTGGVWAFDQLLVAAFYFNPELSESRSKLVVASAGTITA